MQGKLGVLARYLPQVEALTLIILPTRVKKVDGLESRTNQPPLIFADMFSDCGEAWTQVFVDCFLVTGQLAQPPAGENCTQIAALVYHRSRRISVSYLHDAVVGIHDRFLIFLRNLCDVKSRQYAKRRLSSKSNQHILTNRLFSLQYPPKRMCPYVTYRKLKSLPSVRASQQFSAMDEHIQFFRYPTVRPAPSTVR